MPRERSLLERLRDPGSEAPRTIHENTSKLTESVLNNLRRLLNSRHGIAPFQPDYGIPDLSDVIHNLSESQARMRSAIKAAIDKYEPRLRRVTVKAVEAHDDVFMLRFEITAELVTSEERASVWFETRVDPTGEVVVKG